MTSPPFRPALLRHPKTAFKRHEDDILTTSYEDVAQERLLEPNLADLGASWPILEPNLMHLGPQLGPS